jgi:hypothetical protein
MSRVTYDRMEICLHEFFLQGGQMVLVIGGHENCLSLT